MLTYLEEDAALICRCLPKNIARPDDEQFPLFLIYAVLMRAKGTAATFHECVGHRSYRRTRQATFAECQWRSSSTPS